MAEARSDLTGIYRFTSIARPIDPVYLTNRALLFVLPLLALLSASLAWVYDTDSGPLSAAFNGALAAFAAWALTRELAPDYNGAAFVALAFAWVLNNALGARPVLLLFVALLLVRMVNRSTGLPSRPLDTLGIFGFCTWAAISLQQPLILLVSGGCVGRYCPSLNGDAGAVSRGVGQALLARRRRPGHSRIQPRGRRDNRRRASPAERPRGDLSVGGTAGLIAE